VKHTPILLAFAFLVASCAQSTVTSPAVYLHGDLEGRVRLISWDTLCRSFACVRVTVEGSNQSTVTDDRGHWLLKDLTTGPQTIRLERDSFGYIRDFNFQFVGGGVADLPDQIMFEGAQQSLILQSVSVYGSGCDVRALAQADAPIQMRPALELDTDSLALVLHPEYAVLILKAKYDSYPRPFDSLRFDDWTSDTTISSFFPSSRNGKPVFARLGTILFLDWPYTQFYDPYVRRTIPSGIGGQSNVVRVTLQ
jgi:hypothetical protein